jgi:hypothetical protein
MNNAVTDTIDALAPGRLNRMFKSGNKAVVLDDEEEISRILDSALEWLNRATRLAQDSVVPLFSGLVSLAENHIPGKTGAGDMLRFIPGGIGHMARRFVVYQESPEDSPVCFPEEFWNDGRLAPPPPGLVEDIWTLMTRTLASSLSRPVVAGTFGIEVALLVYPPRMTDTENLHALFADSAGRWGRLGFLLDRRGNEAGGLFRRRYLHTLYVLSCLVPGLGSVLQRINRRWANERNDGLSPHTSIIGAPHVDSTKYITALTGSRHNLRTEVMEDDGWAEIPVAKGQLSVFPSGKMARVDSIPPTLHRVLICEPPGVRTSNAPNVSLSLAIVDSPTGERLRLACPAGAMQ